MKDKNVGLILLCVFLILYGVLAVSNLHFQFENFMMGALAILAGVFLLFGK